MQQQEVMTMTKKLNEQRQKNEQTTGSKQCNKAIMQQSTGGDGFGIGW